MNNKLCLLIFGLIFFLRAAYCQEIRGKVVGISDGDTFTLLTNDKKQIKVRLSEIDTPESDQPYGSKAKQALSELVFSKDVLVVQEDIDFRGRLVGHVYVNETHVNRKLVKDGMAWVYRQYNKDLTLLLDEKEARESMLGLWGLSNTVHVPPWEWRKGERGNRTTSVKRETEENSPDFECGTKHYCKDMATCEEAKFYLENCGLTTLDGDGDGIPCEALCQ